MAQCNKLMCKYNLNDKKETQKWLVKNHPDKLNNDNKLDPNFNNILECFKKNTFCNKKSKTTNKNNNKVTVKNREKIFKCMRKVANFSKIDNYHKFDKRDFNPEKLNLDIVDGSPKITQLLNNIKLLDAQDMTNHNKTFKHFIFSDVKDGGYGAKILASAFAANGYHNVIKARKVQGVQKLKLYIDYGSSNDNFGLLCSNSIYGSTFNEKLKHQLLKLFNSRPDNIHGKNVRIIIFDSGFKEGIDLFDVKYVHIFEPSLTIADLKQTIGRATRTCGQKGLDFQPGIGWPLYVYNYYLTLPTVIQNTMYTDKNLAYNIKDNQDTKNSDILLFKDVERISDATILYSNFDKAMINLSHQLYKIGPVLSVDYLLTNNLHNETDMDVDFMNRDMYLLGGAAKSPQSKINKKSKFYNIDVIECYGNCGKKTTMDVPISLDFMKRVYKKYKHPLKLPNKDTRLFLCRYLRKTALNNYCKQLNYEWGLRYSYIPTIVEKSKKKNVKSKLNDLDLGVNQNDNDNNDDVNKTYQYEDYLGKSLTINNSSNSNSNNPLTNRLNFLPMRDYIKNNYYNRHEFVWEPLVIENKCVSQPSSSKQDSKKNDNIVDLTPTQKFISNFFTPYSPYKGILAWHSVGTGKTCTGIATASASFERVGYTILWVTRTTLKTDIWKNMFDQICHDTLAKEVELGLTLPSKLSDRKRLLTDRWLEPMSYKQFSNLLQGKNSIFNILKERNGTTDVLKKTLIIIDEAHKLYGGDLKATERPNTDVMERLIMNSYKTSGKDSCKLLLMTATPFTDSPLELFKLTNLFMPSESEKITTDKKQFIEQYMTKDNILSENGVKNLANHLSGYISYLNREKDPTQFAQPIMINVPILMTHIQDNDIRDGIYLGKKFDSLDKKHKELIEKIKQQIKTLKPTISQHKKDLKQQQQEIKKECKEQFPGVKNKDEYLDCLESAKEDIEELENLIQELTEQLNDLNSQLDKLMAEKPNLKDNNNIKLKIKKMKDSLIQEYIMYKKCQHLQYKNDGTAYNKNVSKKAKSLSLKYSNKNINKLSRKIKSF